MKGSEMKKVKTAKKMKTAQIMIDVARSKKVAEKMAETMVMELIENYGDCVISWTVK